MIESATMSPPNANRTTRPASRRSRDVRSKLITPTSYCPYQDVSNGDDYSSNGETTVLGDDLEVEITVCDMRILGSHAPDNFVTARCQRWDQGNTEHAPICAI